MQYGWKDYFTFNRKERRAVIILVILMIFISFLPSFFPAEEISIQELEAVDSLSTENQLAEFASEKVTPNASQKLLPRIFDPNIVDESVMIEMNLRPKLIKTIINYRSKGGKFFEPNDLRKLFTITKEEADELVPYVRINSVRRTEHYFATEPKYNKPSPIDHVIDINAADVKEIERLPGVSFSLANKIVKYREIIGGFKSVEQLKKTYGMNDSIYTAIKPWINSFPTANQLININTATYKELLYKNIIPETVARAILIYREKHKQFQSISELMNIPFITKELFEKIAPSLTIN